MKEMVLGTCRKTPRKHLWKAGCKISILKSSIYRILKSVNINSTSINTFNEDDFDRRFEFCGWYLGKCAKDARGFRQDYLE